MLTLYTWPGSCGLASHLALEEAAAKYSTMKVDMKNGAQREPAYLAINPKGRVPAIGTPQGILTETPAMLLYIAQTHPAANLAPLDDPFALAEMQAFNSYLCSTVHVAHAHRMRGPRWATLESSFDDMRKKVPENMAACFSLIEDGMLKGPWVMGSHYTVADAYLYTIAGWLEGDSVDIKRFPKVAAHFARVDARPTTQRVLKRLA